MLKLKRFSKFDASCQVSKYLCEAEDRSLSTAHLSDPLLDRSREHLWLSLVTVDIISAPASQAYVERVFSVCGMLTTGRRNRMTKSGGDNCKGDGAFCQIFFDHLLSALLPSVLWRCWFGGRKGIRPVENWVVGCWHGYLSLASVKSRLVLPFWYRKHTHTHTPINGPFLGTTRVSQY